MSAAAALRHCPEATRDTWRDPFGANRLARLWHDLQDLRAHERARLAARHGHLNKPAPRGKLVWLIAGDSADSVLLGCGLAQALRERRLDLQLALTVERLHPYFLERLSGLDRTGWGYMPDDGDDALSRAWQALTPWAAFTCGEAPRANLAHRLAQLPRYRHVAWDDECDPLTLLVAGQVDPNLQTALHGGAARRLWWRHLGCGEDPAPFVAAWREAFGTDLLCLSGCADAAPPPHALPLSTWDRTPLPDGTLMWLDDPKWLPAIAAASRAAHLVDAPRWVAWQALAGGSPVSGEAAPLPLLPRHAVLQHWSGLAADATAARGQADQCRRRFWQVRRAAEEAMSALLDDVFRWN